MNAICLAAADNSNRHILDVLWAFLTGVFDTTEQQIHLRETDSKGCNALFLAASVNNKTVMESLLEIIKNLKMIPDDLTKESDPLQKSIWK